jgi:phage gp16-like protein
MMGRSVVDGPRARNADLAAIHVTKKALGWDDDTYRAVRQAVLGQRSSADLDHASRKRWLAHLQASLTQAQGGAKTPAKPAAKRTAWTPRQKLLWSLWMRLCDAGLVEGRHIKALDAWVKRQTTVDKMEWLTGAQMDAVIEAAKAWLDRKGD